MEFTRFRVEFPQYTPTMIRDTRSPFHISFSEISTNMPELIEDLPRKLVRNLNLTNPKILSITLKNPKNNLPSLFEIEVNEELNLFVNFKKSNDKIWKKIDQREILKADYKGLFIEIVGMRNQFKLNLKIYPLNFTLKAKPKLMNIGQDNCSISHRLEQLSFNKHGAKLRKLSQSELFFGQNKSFLGKRNFEENFDYGEDVFGGEKKLKVAGKRRKYFDLRSFYQSGKGSVQVKNKPFRGELKVRCDPKMTKSVQKLEYSFEKFSKKNQFISPLKTVTKLNFGNGGPIREFNSRILQKTNQIFEKTPSREEGGFDHQGKIRCDLCKIQNDNIDMLKCGHIVCLECILKEDMTFSDCKICERGIEVQPREEEKQKNCASESVRVISARDINLERLGFVVKEKDESSDVEFIEKSIFDKEKPKKKDELLVVQKLTPLTIDTKIKLVKNEIKKKKKKRKIKPPVLEKNWKATKFPKKKEKKKLKIKLKKNPKSDRIEAKSVKSGASGKNSPFQNPLVINYFPKS